MSNLTNEQIKTFSNGLIRRLFDVLDHTKNATCNNDFENIEREISGLEVEIKGSLSYYSNIKGGNKMTSVLMKVSGIKHIPDYNVRRKAVLDSITIINEVIKSLD